MPPEQSTTTCMLPIGYRLFLIVPALRANLEGNKQ